MMFAKKTVLLLILAMGMLLGTACGPEPEEYEPPARPGESPPGYEQPTGQERPLMQPEASPEAPMGEPGSEQNLQTDGQGREQGVPFDAQPTQ
ncbi:hypothetical protein C6366_03180 [Desulfonatronum sp. SC1]|nr:hypothetical protein C6366_03180 [Desulfonatronum sp. SC1]